ncbi:MAG: alkaline phosphatase family protein [Lachnospiraceae bacterium]|nr:alkaline phosphatase family protein [Lachnospiraceae bacterium]
MPEKLNETSLDTVAAAICYAMGIDPPEFAAGTNPVLRSYVDEKLHGEKCSRVLMYNPDAVAEWICRKYPALLREAAERTDIEVPLRSVMPSVTPVCFGTMYTGAQPAVHGIMKYEKPVIRIDTVFDAVTRAGKKAAIVADSECSMGRIFLEREMDYYIYDTLEEVNAKAMELITEDRYDLLVVYNGNYDHWMHKYSPEGIEALSELRCNSEMFAALSVLVERHWKKHNTLLGFAMDHGCHEIDGKCGSHGLDMPEDLNIVHLYKILPRTV